VNGFEIRHAHASDLPYLYDICHRTGYAGQDASDVIGDRAMLGQYFAAWLRGFIHEPAGFPDFVDQYPAHLHIDFLPRAQGRGLGTRVIALFEQKLRENGVAGFHLGMGEKNVLAGRFYEKLGLTMIRHDPGVIFYGRHTGGDDETEHRQE